MPVLANEYQTAWGRKFSCAGSHPVQTVPCLCCSAYGSGIPTKSAGTSAAAAQGIPSKPVLFNIREWNPVNPKTGLPHARMIDGETIFDVWSTKPLPRYTHTRPRSIKCSKPSCRRPMGCNGTLCVCAVTPWFCYFLLSELLRLYA